jgi:AcrR family transcriptional regulator
MMQSVIDDTVLDATARLLERAGVRALSISAIAEEAGISRVTLHRHGVNVDDIVIAVLARASDDLRDALWPVITGAGDAATRLHAALRTLCDIAERHDAVLTAFYGEPARPIPNRPDRTTSLEFIEPFERLMRDGQLDHSLHVTDPAADATLVANAVCWTYLHMRRAHRWSQHKATKHVIALATAHLTSGT